MGKTRHDKLKHERRERKKRKRMPMHGKGQAVMVSNAWKKRLQAQKDDVDMRKHK